MVISRVVLALKSIMTCEHTHPTPTIFTEAGFFKLLTLNRARMRRTDVWYISKSAISGIPDGKGCRGLNL